MNSDPIRNQTRVYSSSSRRFYHEPSELFVGHVNKNRVPRLGKITDEDNLLFCFFFFLIPTDLFWVPANLFGKPSITLQKI